MQIKQGFRVCSSRASNKFVALAEGGVCVNLFTKHVSLAQID